MECISVKDRLPENGEYVLVYSDNPGTGEPKPIAIAYKSNFHDKKGLEFNFPIWEFLNEYHDEFQVGSGAWGDMEWAAYSECVTHWMPLPEAPGINNGSN